MLPWRRFNARALEVFACRRTFSSAAFEGSKAGGANDISTCAHYFLLFSKLHRLHFVADATLRRATFFMV
jgi:hypothetical protein